MAWQALTHPPFPPIALVCGESSLARSVSARCRTVMMLSRNDDRMRWAPFFEGAFVD
jgi:hypothetical protein